MQGHESVEVLMKMRQIAKHEEDEKEGEQIDVMFEHCILRYVSVRLWSFLASDKLAGTDG
jgi:hypothetical protein